MVVVPGKWETAVTISYQVYCQICLLSAVPVAHAKPQIKFIEI